MDTLKSKTFEDIKKECIPLFIQNTPLKKPEMKQQYMRKYFKRDQEKIFFEYSNLVSDKRYTYSTRNGLFDAVLAAYALHMDLLLSPDDLWLCVSNNISNHVNKNPEKYRNFFVSHEGKQKLKVTLPEEHFGGFPNKNNRWDIVTELLSKEIQKNTNGQIATIMQNNFSTSTLIEQVGGQISLMATMKAYFDYYACIPCCGIQNVYFKGKAEDYQQLLEKVKAIKQNYKLDETFEKYIHNVEDIFSKINKQIQEKKADEGFWNKILDEETTYQRLGSGSSAKTKYTGWFVKLFGLYNNNQDSIDKENIPNFECEADVTIEDKNQSKEFEMVFEQSFDGFEEVENNVIKPVQSISIKLKEVKNPYRR